MSNQGRNSTNFRGQGPRWSTSPRPYRGNFPGASRSPVNPELQRELEETKHRNWDLTHEIDQLKGQLREQFAKQEDENRSENNRMENLRSEVRELTRQHEDAKRIIECYNGEWEKLSNEKQKLEVTLKKVSQSSSSEEHYRLEVKHDEALTDLDALQKKCANLESTISAQTSQIKQAEQACQVCGSELNEQKADNAQLKEQVDQQYQEIIKLGSQVEKRTNETMELRQEVAGLQQPHSRDSQASQTLTVIGTNANEQAAVNNLIDQVASQVGEWHSDLETPKAAVEAHGPGDEIKQSEPQPSKVSSEAAISQDNALNDEEISAASMEIYSKLVRRSRVRNKANLEGCIRICNHLNVSPGNLKRALEKQVPEYDHNLDPEELLAKLKKLHSDDAATMQSARGILKNAGITEATLRALPGSLHDNKLQDVVDTMLLKWQAKGASAFHTGSRGAGSNPQPRQYSSTAAETQTDAAPEFFHVATQTDAAPDSSQAATQTDAAPEFFHVATQTDAAPDSSQAATQTDAAPEFFHVATQTDAAPDSSQAATQTDAAPDSSQAATQTDAAPDFFHAATQTNAASDSFQAATQTDAAPDFFHAATQTDPMESKTYRDMGVQREPITVEYSHNFDDYVGTGSYVDAMDLGFMEYPEEATNVDPGVQKYPDYVDSAVQTNPDNVNDSDDISIYANNSTQTDPKNDDDSENVPNYVNVGIQKDPDNVFDISNLPSYINKGTQTQRRLPPNRYILFFLFLLFLLLCGGFLAWAISNQVDALRERAMWLDANDMSRRATIYLTDASAHGRRLGWLWRPSALRHVEKPYYYYAESMVGFGVTVQ